MHQTAIELRPLDRSDVDELAAMFDRFSPKSRYLRFFSPITSVPVATVRHLAEVDHRSHEAVAALDGGLLVGAAHYFRSVDDPRRAEISVEVDDDHQGRGIGRMLLHALAELALDAGVTTFTASALVENRAAIALFRRAGWPTVARFDGPEFLLVMMLSR